MSRTAKEYAELYQDDTREQLFERFAIAEAEREADGLRVYAEELAGAARDISQYGLDEALRNGPRIVTDEGRIKRLIAALAAVPQMGRECPHSVLNSGGPHGANHCAACGKLMPLPESLPAGKEDDPREIAIRFRDWLADAIEDMAESDRAQGESESCAALNSAARFIRKCEINVPAVPAVNSEPSLTPGRPAP